METKGDSVMTSDLTNEFMAGYQARIDMGVCLEREPIHCPHIATSNCADAWHAGHAFAYDAMAGNTHCRFAVSKAWHGRGYLVNVETRHGADKYRMQYKVEYRIGGRGFASLVLS